MAQWNAQTTNQSPLCVQILDQCSPDQQPHMKSHAVVAAQNGNNPYGDQASRASTYSIPVRAHEYLLPYFHLEFPDAYPPRKAGPRNLVRSDSAAIRVSLCWTWTIISITETNSNVLTRPPSDVSYIHSSVGRRALEDCWTLHSKRDSEELQIAPGKHGAS